VAASGRLVRRRGTHAELSSIRTNSNAGGTKGLGSQRNRRLFFMGKFPKNPRAELEVGRIDDVDRHIGERSGQAGCIRRGNVLTLHWNRIQRVDGYDPHTNWRTRVESSAAIGGRTTIRLCLTNHVVTLHLRVSGGACGAVGHSLHSC